MRHSMAPRTYLPFLLLIVGSSLGVRAGETDGDLTPPKPAESEQQQLPRKMHARMSALPTIKVGHGDADIVGTDNRALQAAVDYVASLEGGTVEIGPGEYAMHDSLHLRPFVAVRGAADGK